MTISTARTTASVAGGRYRTDVTERRLLPRQRGPTSTCWAPASRGVYGTTTLAQIESLVSAVAAEAGFETRAVQSNHEGELGDAIHGAREDCAGIIVKPCRLQPHLGGHRRRAALGQRLWSRFTSAISMRANSFGGTLCSEVADVVIAGAGAAGYEFAVRYLLTS